jgi:hypothetical protein
MPIAITGAKRLLWLWRRVIVTRPKYPYRPAAAALSGFDRDAPRVEPAVFDMSQALHIVNACFVSWPARSNSAIISSSRWMWRSPCATAFSAMARWVSSIVRFMRHLPMLSFASSAGVESAIALGWDNLRSIRLLQQGGVNHARGPQKRAWKLARENQQAIYSIARNVTPVGSPRVGGDFSVA